MMRLISALVTLSIVVFDEVGGVRLRDEMYESLYAGGACYRRLNGTHQIGCSSVRGGSVGVVHAVRDVSDVEWIVKNGSAPPYVALLPVNAFDETIVEMLLKNAPVIAGVIVYNNGTETDGIGHFSHERRCPNRLSQWNNSCDESQSDDRVWNPHGTGLMYRDYPFSMFYLPPDKIEDAEKIHECYLKFNAFDREHQSERSLCAVEMDAFMFGAVNSQVCTRRSNIVKNLSPARYCESLMDHSIHMTLFPRGAYSAISGLKNESAPFEERFKLVKPRSVEKEGTVALVTAAMDATTMLEGFGGAVSTVSGLVTLLATAHALRRMIPFTDHNLHDKNVMFVILNGESYDYIGSQRMAWDLAAESFPQKGSDPTPPLSARSIGAHVHIGQLQNGPDPLRIFTPVYESERRQKVKTFIESMKPEEIPINLMDDSYNLPPSSVHSFLRLLNSSIITQMFSMIVTDHENNFRNQFYQSVFDNKHNMKFEYKNLSDQVTKDDNNNTVYPDRPFQNDSECIQLRLANVSTMIARALYKHVTGDFYSGVVKASPFIVDELLHCYLDSIACKLLNVVQPPSAPPISPSTDIPPASLYVGASPWSPVSHTTAQFAAFLSGSDIKRNKSDCKALENESVDYEWLSDWFGNGTCIRSIINFTQAVSPAFMEENYDFSSGIYSTWTESYWSPMSLRILVKPAAWRENLAIGVGFTILALSIVIVIIGKRHVVWLIDSNVLDTTGNISSQNSARVDC